MLAHLWRNGAFPRSEKRLRRVLSSTIDIAAIVTAIVGIAISPVRAEHDSNSPAGYRTPVRISAAWGFRVWGGAITAPGRASFDEL